MHYCYGNILVSAFRIVYIRNTWVYGIYTVTANHLENALKSGHNKKRFLEHILNIP
jgi:hypothetical protein